MKVICEQCHSTINVPDDKLPRNQMMRLNCPKCKYKITINTNVNETPKVKSAADIGTNRAPRSRKGETKKGGDYTYSYDDYSDDEDLDFFAGEAKLALVMLRDGEQAALIKTAVEGMGFRYVSSVNTRDALGKLRFHQFDLILLAEGFDNQGLEVNPIINHLNHIPISIRRRTFFALIGDHFKTMDEMMAFAMSVNLVINSNDLPLAGRILSKGISDFQKFYKAFMDVLVEVGKA